jgi:DNA-binding NtrC family response regulator
MPATDIKSENQKVYEDSRINADDYNKMKSQQNSQNIVILIYDDDVEISFLCKEILSKAGYHVVTRSRCENICSDVEELNPQIILMDLWIPTIGGEKAIELLREKSMTNVPVIIFSANAEIEKISKRINANGFLEKPFNSHP